MRSPFLRIVSQKRFIIGFLFLFLVLFASFTFKSLIEPHFPFSQVRIMYDDAGNVLAQAPYPPSLSHPFGTDKSGDSLLLQLTEGAKYTMGIALIVTVIQMVLSLVIGVALSFLHRRLYYPFYHFFNGAYYVPTTLIAYIILAPVVLVYVWSFTQIQQIVAPIVVLSLISVPSFSIQIAEEIRLVKKREFIGIARTMGGGPIHIFWHHVMPFLKTKLVIFFSQKLVQVLVLIVALAILSVYIGGANIHAVALQQAKNYRGPIEYKSVVDGLHNEWGGLIGKYKDDVKGYPWMVYVPAGAFCTTIISIQMMASALKRVFENEDRKRKRRRKRGKTQSIAEEDLLFNFIEKQHHA